METKEKQLQMWADLTLNYCRDRKIFKITKSNFLNTIGNNKSISRKLNIDAVHLIFDYAVEKSKNLNFLIKILDFFQQVKKDSKEEVFVLWRTISDWGKYVHDCAIKQHKIDSLETFDHILTDELFETEGIS